MMKQIYNRRVIAFLVLAITFMALLIFSFFENPEPEKIFALRVRQASNVLMLLVMAFMAYYWNNKAKRKQQ